MATAKKKDEAPAPQMGSNIGGVLDFVRNAKERVIELKKKRTEINAELKAIREGVEAKGVQKRAFDLALSYFESDPEQREGFDESYIIAREAMGLKVKGAQLDIFEQTQAPAQAPAEGDDIDG